MKVSIYVMYRSKGNPRGEGAAAAIIEYIDGQGNTHIRKQAVRVNNETKNALALKICISALRTLLKPCEATIYIDSEYLSNTHRQRWPERWKQAGWKRATGKPPANIEDWKQFYMLEEIHTVQIEPYNNRYDTELEKNITRSNNSGKNT